MSLDNLSNSDEYSEDDFDCISETEQETKEIESKKNISLPLNKSIGGKNLDDQKENKYPSRSTIDASVKEPNLLHNTGVPSESNYISIANLQLSEKEAKYLYGIDKCKDNPKKIVLLKQCKKKEVKPTFSHRRLLELSAPRNRDLANNFNQDNKRMAKPMTLKGCNSFVERMECEEKRRRLKQERIKLLTQYEVSVDKKECPRCGNIQSFDEMMEKRNKCPNESCGGSSYRSRKKFCLNTFRERMEKSEQRRHEIVTKILEERKVKKKHVKSRKQKELQEKVSKNHPDFLSRMSEDIARRTKKISNLEKTQRESEKRTCTFRPVINVSPHLLRERPKDSSAVLAEPKNRKARNEMRIENPKVSKRTKQPHRRNGRDACRNKKKNPSKKQKASIASQFQDLLL